jgi:hypothetical protein
MCHKSYEHPFLSHFVPWTVMYPPFTSGKLLNASGWDDIQGSGKLSSWTLSQRPISLRILEDELASKSPESKDIALATIQTLLSFEVCPSAYPDDFDAKLSVKIEK